MEVAFGTIHKNYNPQMPSPVTVCITSVFSNVCAALNNRLIKVLKSFEYAE